MKYFQIALIFIVFIPFLKGQSYEQVALDFYATAILDTQQNRKVYFDGNISDEVYSDDIQGSKRSTVEEFYGCKIPRNAPDSIVMATFEIWEKIQGYKFSIIPPKESKLTIPKSIIYIPNLESKTARNQLKKAVDKILNRNYIPEYQLSISPSAIYKNHAYVEILLQGIEDQSIQIIHLRINSNKEIADWCKTGKMYHNGCYYSEE